MIPDEDVERVREAADIVALIGESVRLKRVGNSWRGPCPFHQGKGDNFSVMPTGGYRCFVCGETGNVFTFVQKRLGLDFPEAVKHLGAKFGVSVREVTRRVEGPDPRAPFWEVVAAAAAFFQGALWEDAEGEVARRYLASRGVSREVADRFGLGYAPRTIGAMRHHLHALGFDDERQLTAGVLAQKEEHPEPRPRFRGRLMFTIRDAAGHPVGFGGRALTDDQAPKYLNSAENAVFQKRELLYHLDQARHAIRRAGRALVVEGYFDALRVAAAGIEEVVAPLGTALTPQQAALLARSAKEVFLLYDGDKAGLKATFRAGDELLAAGIAVRVVTLPAGEDPDTFTARHGAVGLEAQLRQAVDVLERKIQLLERGGWLADLHKKREAIDRLLPTLRAPKDPVTRDLYVARAAAAAGIAVDTLAREVAGGGRARRRASDPPPADAPGGDAPAAPRRRGRTPGEAAERELVRIALADPGAAERIAEALDVMHAELPEDAAPALRHPGYAAVFRALLNAGPGATDSALAEVLDPDGVAELERLRADGATLADVDEQLTALRVRLLDERLAGVVRRMLVADEAEKRALLAEQSRLKREVLELTGRGR